MSAPVLVHADAGLREGWGHLRESFEIAKALRERAVDCLMVLPQGLVERIFLWMIGRRARHQRVCWR